MLMTRQKAYSALFSQLAEISESNLKRKKNIKKNKMLEVKYFCCKEMKKLIFLLPSKKEERYV